MIKSTVGLILLLFLLFFPGQVEGRIFICIDEAGGRHYSDKKCPITKKYKTEVIDNLGKITLPDSILEFTPIIQIVKRTLNIMNEQMPHNEQYQEAYKYSIDAEIAHNAFLAKPHKKLPKKYNPFNPVQLINIISTISHGCRVEAHMTICGAIESNYWLYGEEQIYLRRQRESGFENVNTPSRQKKVCDKATVANQSGVISRKMLSYFCK